MPRGSVVLALWIRWASRAFLKESGPLIVKFFNTNQKRMIVGMINLWRNGSNSKRIWLRVLRRKSYVKQEKGYLILYPGIDKFRLTSRYSNIAFALHIDSLAVSLES